MRRHSHQAVHGAALENSNQHFPAAEGARARDSGRCPCHENRQAAEADSEHSNAAGFEKSASTGHGDLVVRDLLPLELRRAQNDADDKRDGIVIVYRNRYGGKQRVAVVAY